MTDKPIVLQTGNIISPKESKVKFDASQLEGVFTSPEVPDYDSADHKPGTREARGRKAKKDRSWEKESMPTRTASADTQKAMKKVLAEGGKKSVEDWAAALEGTFDKDRLAKGNIKPSRSGAETNEGGRSTLPGPHKNSIFNPNAIAEAKNSEMTDAVINDARNKKKEREAKKQRSRDWEQPSIAQNSKDFKPAQMGYTPNRTAHQQPELPEVKSREIEAVKAQSRENAKKAQKAAKIAEQLRDIYLSDMEKAANDNRTWEQQKLDEIEAQQKKSYTVEEDSVKVSRDFVPTEQKKLADIQEGLRSVFTMPQNPEEVQKEASIKRKSDIKTARKKREDDRSWEKVSTPKKTKKF